MTQQSDRERELSKPEYHSAPEITIVGAWPRRPGTKSEGETAPTEAPQCDRAMGQSLGYFVRCSLPINHTAHHIAFGRTTDTQSITWVRDDIHETLVPTSPVTPMSQGARHEEANRRPGDVPKPGPGTARDRI